MSVSPVLFDFLSVADQFAAFGAYLFSIYCIHYTCYIIGYARFVHRHTLYC